MGTHPKLQSLPHVLKFGGRRMVAEKVECLRKYMRDGSSGLSLPALDMKFQIREDESLMDSWVERVLDASFKHQYNHFHMYLEMKAALTPFETENGLQLSVSDQLIKDTAKWLKHRYFSWEYGPKEKYPKGCTPVVLRDLFCLPSPKPSPGTASVEDVSYKDSRTLPFIYMAAKVVALESLFDTRPPLENDTEQRNCAKNECRRTRSEAAHLKTLLVSVKNELTLSRKTHFWLRRMAGPHGPRPYPSSNSRK
eukprot:Gregarina_sp_Pseudo_9__5303@NODE_617_length_2481_cov_4467_178542_g583_i0_p1_GENE_NODE_617_length_2481_cov_4467_178542_g583_i0NODE_617_length_2481_cov_4467_178542_g583_i0_p1_ORF_typecomplete_len252_score40_19_NODE_617_length_2481_cov_4467_178542_g583_i0202957